MTEYLILQDWKEYDSKKEKLGEDPRIFCSGMLWEVEFLVSRIKHILQLLDEDTIRLAVFNEHNLEETAIRQDFVGRVLRRLQPTLPDGKT